MKEKGIFYAVDNSPKYLYLAKKSIESIRRYDKKIDICLFVYGKPSPRAVNFAKKSKVQVYIMKAVPKDRGTFLKWLALPEMSQYERVIFADADTYFFSSPSKLFSKYKTKDFYAREEFATTKGKPFWFFFGKIQLNQIDHRIFAKIAKTLNVKVIPIFNTGIMIFNNNFSRENILPEIGKFEILRRKFASGEIANAITGTMHIIDEVCASLVFGGVKGLKWGLISSDDSPWYIEWRERRVKSPGVVLHTWTSYWPAFCYDFFGESGLSEFYDWIY